MGHVEGPFAPVNIKRKLHEMDEVVRRVYAGLGDADLLLVTAEQLAALGRRLQVPRAEP